MKEAQRKRQEKAEDLEAKRRIKAKIEADKEERRHKAEQAKALREGRVPVEAVTATPTTTTTVSTDADKPAAGTQARLRLQTSAGNITKTLPGDTTLHDVALLIKEETGLDVTKMSTTFPRKTFSGTDDFCRTLKDAGWTPSAAIIVE